MGNLFDPLNTGFGAFAPPAGTTPTNPNSTPIVAPAANAYGAFLGNSVTPRFGATIPNATKDPAVAATTGPLAENSFTLPGASSITGPAQGPDQYATPAPVNNFGPGGAFGTTTPASTGFGYLSPQDRVTDSLVNGGLTFGRRNFGLFKRF